MSNLEDVKIDFTYQGKTCTSEDDEDADQVFHDLKSKTADGTYMGLKVPVEPCPKFPCANISQYTSDRVLSLCSEKALVRCFVENGVVDIVYKWVYMSETYHWEFNRCEITHQVLVVMQVTNEADKHYSQIADVNWKDCSGHHMAGSYTYKDMSVDTFKEDVQLLGVKLE
jgi:hypothetical protein